MTHIIFPTDFSPNAEKAFEFACLFAKKAKAELILVNAFDLPYSQNVMSTSLLDILKETSVNGLENEKAKAKERGLNAHTFSLMGNPIRVTKDVVKRFPDSIVIMGTTGASGVEEVLLGSNAASILHTVVNPVIVIPADAELKEFKTITYASDYLSDRNDTALAQLASVCRLFDAKLHILHLNSSKDTAANRERAHKRFEKHFEGIEYAIEEHDGENIEREILSFAKDKDSDLVSLLSHNYGVIEGLFHKSMTSKVAYHSKMPFMALNDEK